MAILQLRNLRYGVTDRAIYRERRSYETLDMFASRKLIEQAQGWSSTHSYDIFLSHSIKDAPAILMLSLLLQDQGLTVYVDWVDDPLLDRTKVTTATAKILRDRLRSSKSLLLALTSNSARSSWVQWELGLGDGQKNGRVAILPLETENDSMTNFYRQEYLGLYPFVDEVSGIAFVNGLKSIRLTEWISKTNPLQDIIYG